MKKIILFTLAALLSLHRPSMSRFQFTGTHKFISAVTATCMWLLYPKKQGGKKNCLTYNFTDPQTWHNTSLLKNSDLVYQGLKDAGFQESLVHVEESDIKLETYSYNVECADTIIIAMPGFRRGEAADVSSLFYNIKTLEQEENKKYGLVFFNPRNRGKSSKTQSWITDFKQYTTDQYKDVIAQITHITQAHPHKNIVLHGMCAGGFHIMKAIQELKKQSPEDAHNSLQNIKGCIIDSAWKQFSEVVPTGIESEVDKQLRHWAMKWLRLPTKKLLRNVIYNPWFKRHHTTLPGIETNLVSNNQDMKFLFIHWKSDTYAPFADIEPITSNSSPNCFTYWIEPEARTRHACHNLKLPKEYHDQLKMFLQKIE